MTLIPLYKLLQTSSPGTLVAVYSAVAGAAAVAFALLPRRALQVVPVVLLAALVAASVASSRYVARQARAQQQSLLGTDSRWIDHLADGSVAYLYNGEPDWNRVWETLFWNDRVDRVYDLASEVPGPLPQTPADVQPDGTVFLPPSGKRPGPYAVVSTSFDLVGSRVAPVSQQDLSQAGLALWRIDRPLRVSTRVSGMQANGDIYAHSQARLVAYGCSRGRFRLTLLIKEPETIDVRLDGRLVRRLSYPSPAPDEVWRGEVPVTGRPGNTCTLEVAPSGLLGTTVFAFERG